MTWLHALTSPRSRFRTRASERSTRSTVLYSIQYSDVTVLLILVVCKPSSRFTAPQTVQIPLANNIVYHVPLFELDYEWLVLRGTNVTSRV